MTPAVQARQNAGLSLEQAAKRCRVSVRYLRRVEQCGAPYVLAVRLAALYQTSLNTFLPIHSGRETPTIADRGESRKAVTRS